MKTANTKISEFALIKNYIQKWLYVKIDVLLHTIICVFTYVYVHDTCRILMCTKICSEMSGKYFNIQDKSSKYYTVPKNYCKILLGRTKSIDN